MLPAARYAQYRKIYGVNRCKISGDMHNIHPNEKSKSRNKFKISFRSSLPTGVH